MSTMVNTTLKVLQDVSDERVLQDIKWGIQSHPNGTSARIYGGTRDQVRELTDRKAQERDLTWLHILQEEFYEALAEEDPQALRAELIQVAAVAAAWAEDIDRKAMA